jgi:hypothetical protein
MFKHDAEWRRKNLAKQNKWREKHPDKIAARNESQRKILPDYRASYRVFELFGPDDPALPRYVGCASASICSWKETWTQRATLPGALAEWFRTLEGPPTERVFLGSETPLTRSGARAVVRWRVGEINAMATGRTDRRADFLLN